ncbi:hypothetical protein J31TS4_33420 [Paenibacillus sp. J31TS4]|nr:hypothetical protein J31TS4_33420 [Paenibacillus sp. J31TS4]
MLAFQFFTLALLVWSLVDFFRTGRTGIEFDILLVGVAIYFWSRVYYKRKSR